MYLGQHVLVLRLQAAVKVLHTNLSSAYQGGFLQEANTIADLKHPHIIRILDFGIDRDTTPYLIMDYASQGTMRNRYPKGSIVPIQTVVSYVKQIADALQYAHDRNLVHRDLKSENLLIGENGEILVSDFGIATVVHGTTSMETGIYAGTAFYSAPEQIEGKPRPASDQYSLGIIAYEWLTGERPFTGTLREVISQQFGVLPRPLREMRPDLPPLVEEVVMKSLTKDPKLRFKRIQAFATAFEHASISSDHVETSAPTAPSSKIPTNLEETKLSSSNQTPTNLEKKQLSQQSTINPLEETHASQQSVITPLTASETKTSAQTRRVLSRRGMILISLILLLVVFLSVLCGVGLYNYHVNQVEASATATAIPQLTATAAESIATVRANLATAQTNATATAAVTPSVNPNAPAPYGGTLAVNDSLQHDSGLGWFVPQDSDGSTCSFSDGSYHIVSPVVGNTHICTPGASRNFSDLAFEVSMKVVKGNFGGMVFRYNHVTNTGYVLIVGVDGSCYFYTDHSGHLTQLNQIVTTDLKTGLGQTNIIAAVAKGSMITLYANEQQFGNITDGSFSSGIIGLLAGSFSGGSPADVAYNNAKVWTL